MRGGEGATTETYAVVRRREERSSQRRRWAFFSGLLAVHSGHADVPAASRRSARGSEEGGRPGAAADGLRQRRAVSHAPLLADETGRAGRRLSLDGEGDCLDQRG